MNTIYLLPPFQFPTKLQKSSWSLTYIVFQSTTTYAENMLSFSVLCTSALSRLTQSIVLFCPRAYSEPDISSSIKPLGINTLLLKPTNEGKQHQVHWKPQKRCILFARINLSPAYCTPSVRPHADRQ